jgi:hypothetical protein
MNHRADRRLDGQREAIHQAVGHTDAFDPKWRDFPWRAGGDFPNVSSIVQVVFREFSG